MMCPELTAILKRIQYHVFSRRIRLITFFEDFDGLRHYKVSKANFLRILDSCTLTFLSQQERELICKYYVDEESADIKYKNFLDDIETVFRTTHLELTPTQTPPGPGELLDAQFSPKATLGSVQEDEYIAQLLKKMELLASTRGVVFKYSYQPFDPIHHGVVTKTQFHRAFPFHSLSSQDIDLVAKKFTNEKNLVNYQAIHDLITISTYSSEPPIPTSTLTVCPDNRLWEQQLMEPEKKIQALVVMNRIRLKDYFYDYDKLRKGVVTRHQARSIFDNILGIKILENDWNRLVDKYSRLDGMFKWKELCDLIDEAFMIPELEKDCNRRSNLPTPSTTEAARRNKMLISESCVASINALETDIRRYINNARKHMLPIFQDFDKSNRGFVTKSQFSRAMAIGGFEMTQLQVEILAMKYCNIGTYVDFNYRDFLKAVDYSCDVFIDPTPRDIRDSVYFNKEGKIIPFNRDN